jgi:hypothetical protein
MNYGWHSPAQSFLVPSPAGLMAMFYWSTVPRAVYPTCDELTAQLVLSI